MSRLQLLKILSFDSLKSVTVLPFECFLKSNYSTAQARNEESAASIYLKNILSKENSNVRRGQ